MKHKIYLSITAAALLTLPLLSQADTQVYIQTDGALKGAPLTVNYRYFSAQGVSDIQTLQVNYPNGLIPPPPSGQHYLGVEIQDASYVDPTTGTTWMFTGPALECSASYAAPAPVAFIDFKGSSVSGILECTPGAGAANK